MDKLQWFKFTPSDWMMGKIQRCPEITQARFLRLCCMYWNKDCELSIEDSIIEIDQEHFEILISKKILTKDSKNVYISFLDEQNLEIKEVYKDKSTSGIVGNLKRWHHPIYQRFKAKEISLEEAIELSKTIAPASHTDSIPIAPPSQNIADNIKTIQDEDEIRKDEEKKRKEFLLEKETKSIFKFYKELEKLGAEKDLLNDWNKVRKKKNATDTKTALDKFISQVYLSGKDINQILRICIEKDWKGFEAEWIKENKNLQNGNQQNTAATKQKFRDTFSNLAKKHQQAETGNTEGELFEDTEYTELE